MGEFIPLTREALFVDVKHRRETAEIEPYPFLQHRRQDDRVLHQAQGPLTYALKKGESIRGLAGGQAGCTTSLQGWRWRNAAQGHLSLVCSMPLVLPFPGKRWYHKNRKCNRRVGTDLLTPVADQLLESASEFIHVEFRRCILLGAFWSSVMPVMMGLVVTVKTGVWMWMWMGWAYPEIRKWAVRKKTNDAPDSWLWVKLEGSAVLLLSSSSSSSKSCPNISGSFTIWARKSALTRMALSTSSSFCL